jgi:2-phosphosulfolactate phosphatase
MATSIFEQAGYRIRFERGERGLRSIIRGCSVVVVVDVLSFSTAADIAVTAGAAVFATPYFSDARAVARRYEAMFAVPRREESEAHPYSLSPDSLLTIPPASRIVLPSLNGATLIATARESKARWILTGCLRNASAVAAFIRDHLPAENIAVVSAGERWPNLSLRPALEDDLGAGAIISQLDLTDASPEAQFVANAFLSTRDTLAETVRSSVSGRELADFGYPHDVESAVQYSVSGTVPAVGPDGFLSTAIF